MARDQLRVGIIGAGVFALQSHWTRIQEDGRAAVTAICRRNKELLAEAAKITGVRNTYGDWRAMLENERLDAVIVCTPNDFHVEPTMAALKRDLHVLVEKPMALSSRDANAVVAATKTAKAKLMVSYKYRCDPIWRAVHRIIAEGTIGKVRQVSTVSHTNLVFIYDPANKPLGAQNALERGGQFRPFMEDRLKEGNWRSDPGVAGGGWFVDLHTHMVDAMLWFGGSGASEVACFLRKDGLPAERAISAQAVLENGVLFSFAYTDGVNTDPGDIWGNTQITIAGDSGVIVGTGKRFELMSDGKRAEITSDETTGGTIGMFLGLIAEGKDNPAPADECARAVALVEACYRSAEEKRIVKIG